MNIREFRDHLQKRLLAGQSTVVDPLSLRSTTIASNRTDSAHEPTELGTPEFSIKMPSIPADAGRSSSSSDITMPGLAVSVEDDGLSAQSSIPPVTAQSATSSFAKNVRNELELLSEKSIASDASTWAKQSNIELIKRDLSTQLAPGPK